MFVDTPMAPSPQKKRKTGILLAKDSQLPKSPEVDEDLLILEEKESESANPERKR
jgi:hypothetical protein